MYSINSEQQLYVKSTGHGVTCWGFSNAFEQTELLAERLGVPGLAPLGGEFGQLAVIEKHEALIERAKTADLGTWYRKRTPVRVKQVLELLLNNDRTVRIFYGDANTGESSLDEFDTVGTIGRSIGPLKVPLLIPRGESFGGQISDDRIVRIVAVDSGKNLYRHPGFHVPTMSIKPGDNKRYPWEVSVKGAVAARFAKFEKACAWIAFMAGECHTEPA